VPIARHQFARSPGRCRKAALVGVFQRAAGDQQHEDVHDLLQSAQLQLPGLEFLIEVEQKRIDDLLDRVGVLPAGAQLIGAGIGCQMLA